MTARRSTPFGTPRLTTHHPTGIRSLSWPDVPEGLDVTVTTRHGGVSTGPYTSLNLALHVGDEADRVAENRRRAALAFGARPRDLVFAEQVHGASVHAVGTDDRGRGLERLEEAVPSCDALVTAVPGVVLVILVADCLPIVLFDPVARILAVVHAGWRGTVAGVAAGALGALTATGSHPADVVAAFGPAVSPRTYEVDERVAEPFRSVFGSRAAELLEPKGAGHYLLDLPAANRWALIDAGMRPGMITPSAFTTGSEGYFSHRASRPTGRFAMMARIRP